MNDFGIKISKNDKMYTATFWFLDTNRIVSEESKNFFTRFFAIRWSKKKIFNKIASQYMKEKGND